MQLHALYVLMFILSSGLLLAQLFVKRKTAAHLCFAVFCGSLVMVAAQYLGGGQLGGLSYFVALGTCATCNVFWLVSRALFRGEGAITWLHVMASIVVGLMMMSTYGLTWLKDLSVFDAMLHDPLQEALQRVIVLTSSTMLMLSVWEGCRELPRSRGAELAQRLLFLGSFIGALIACKVVSPLISTPGETDYHQWIVVICSIQIMVMTQCLIIWRTASAIPDRAEKHCKYNSALGNALTHDTSQNESEETAIAQHINDFLVKRQGYLQNNLRIGDLARELAIPEYKIRQIMRRRINCQHFNQYLNTLRVHHARQLLENPDYQHWPVLVVAMESGFASVGPFTRAFKQQTGMPPGQYRQRTEASTLTTAASIR